MNYAQLRRLAVLLDGQGNPIPRLQAALEGQREAVRRLLASALPVVEAFVCLQCCRERYTAVAILPRLSPNWD